MEARYFNSIMPKFNELWVGRVLNADVNFFNGPDIIGNDFDMEVKFTLVGEQCNAQKYPKTWTILEHQLNYLNRKEIYWGFGTYSLAKPVSKIRTSDLKNLEQFVKRRELWITPWNFIDMYEKHDTRGKSKITGIEWRNILIYPKLKDLPPVMENFEVDKGKIHLTKGVNLELFGF